jgi:hypothetical protein
MYYFGYLGLALPSNQHSGTDWAVHTASCGVSGSLTASQSEAFSGNLSIENTGPRTVSNSGEQTHFLISSSRIAIN